MNNIINCAVEMNVEKCNYSEDCITEIRGTPVNKQYLVKVRLLTSSHFTKLQMLQ